MLKSFKSRITITFFLLTVFLTSIFFFTLYEKTVSIEKENFSHYMKNTVSVGAAFIRGDEILKVSTREGCAQTPEHQRLVRELKKITGIDEKIDDAYVVIPSGKENQFYFVANANREISPVGCGEKYDASQFPEMINALSVAGVDRELTKDKWGEWLSAYAPIYDPAGKVVAVLGIDIAAKTIKDLQQVFLERFLIVLLLTLFLALLIGILSSQWLTRPIDEIIGGMERVGEGDLNHSLRNTPQAEFNKIVLIFNKMTDSLKRNLEELTKTVGERERINRELEIAAELQQSALPAHPPVTKDLDIAASSVPAKEVGGDYFDFIADGDGRTGFVIADATGKGFSGTLFMTNSRSVFRVVQEDEKTPCLTLQRTNDFISTNGSSNGMFITFLYSIYDSHKKTLTCSNAGHHLPIIFGGRTRKFKSLHMGGIPLGVFPDQEYPEETVALESGDIVLMYTDGVIEAMDAKKEMYGMAQLMRTLEENSHLDATAILKRIESDVQMFVDKEPQFDDITMIVFKVK